MDEDNFTCIMGGWSIVMLNGELEINDTYYEEDENDPTYDLVRAYWRLTNATQA